MISLILEAVMMAMIIIVCYKFILGVDRVIKFLDEFNIGSTDEMNIFSAEDVELIKSIIGKCGTKENT